MPSNQAVLIMTHTLDREHYASYHLSRFPQDRTIKVKTGSEFENLSRDRALSRQESTILLMGREFAGVEALEAKEILGGKGLVLGCICSVTEKMYFEAAGIDFIWVENYRHGAKEAVDWITEKVHGIEPALKELDTALVVIGEERAKKFRAAFSVEPESIEAVRERLDHIEDMKGTGDENIEGFKRFLRDRATGRFVKRRPGPPN